MVKKICKSFSLDLGGKNKADLSERHFCINHFTIDGLLEESTGML